MMMMIVMIVSDLGWGEDDGECVWEWDLDWGSDGIMGGKKC